MKKGLRFSLLRRIAVVAVFAGVVGSLALMFHAGRHNTSVILIALFFIWVLSPFIGVLMANVFAKHWSDLFCVILYSLMIILPVGSLVAYSGVLNPTGAKTSWCISYCTNNLLDAYCDCYTVSSGNDTQDIR